MIRTFVFLAKLLAFVAAAVWVADRAGKVTIEWQDTIIETSAALALGFILLLLFFAYHASRGIANLRHTPRLYRMHTRLRQHRQGEKLLGDAMQALTEEQKDKALSLAKKAEKLIGPSQALDLVKHQADAIPKRKWWGGG